MYNKLSDVTARLSERYSGETYKRVGQGGKEFTYIPWHVSARLLNDIFGVFGWTASAPQVTADEGQVNVSFGITVRVRDDSEDPDYGATIEKTVPCVGSAALRDDNSAKAAMSDALSKGVKFLGDAFGFYLSETKNGGGASPAPRRVGSNGGRSNGQQSYTIKEPNAPASDAQVGFLTKNGYSEAEARDMTKGQASAAIQAIKDEVPF